MGTKLLTGGPDIRISFRFFSIDCMNKVFFPPFIVSCCYVAETERAFVNLTHQMERFQDMLDLFHVSVSEGVRIKKKKKGNQRTCPVHSISQLFHLATAERLLLAWVTTLEAHRCLVSRRNDAVSVWQNFCTSQWRKKFFSAVLGCENDIQFSKSCYCGLHASLFSISQVPSCFLYFLFIFSCGF